MRAMSEPADPPFSLPETVLEKNQPIICMGFYFGLGPNRLQPGFGKLCCRGTQGHTVCIGKFTYIRKVQSSVVHSTLINTAAENETK